MLFDEQFATPNSSEITCYKIGRQIGKGAYALVFEAVHRQSGSKVAIK